MRASTKAWMPRARAYGLTAMADCFVSLHRSEGFGLGLAEAMLLGKPVIATGYSGTLDFMNRDNSLLIDYKIVEIAEDRPIYTKGNFWAEPSIEHAASCMRQVYEHQDEANERAVRAQPQIKSLLSIEAAGQRMRERRASQPRAETPALTPAAKRALLDAHITGDAPPLAQRRGQGALHVRRPAPRPA
jgi:hypothetical protein